jgi:hypothetical protein
LAEESLTPFIMELLVAAQVPFLMDRNHKGTIVD